ncbi:dTMP kinase [Mycobacterium sp. MYCO198283]|uniref:dTMP kinase n=1 Tax=Mycobacterium sp. MYCO198283 TaxID=2883505 RepID=UPI001E381A85|nr:dTMP kinase [Mycobacterium sp. MYCO198283]MCG5431611.1 dTMP kinase [Mycobacterium sp. MYCO198283]
MLLAIEGVDGAGKRTIATGLRDVLVARGRTVATLAFPRYGRSVTADLAAEALRGHHGDLADSVYAMATLFALDRADARDELDGLRAAHDVVILDRYVASNAAYSAARLHQDGAGEAVEWVRRLEHDRLGLPVCDVQLLLDVPVDVADARARHRETAEVGRDRDAYERDADLQRRTGEVYRQLAAAGWGGRWLRVGPDALAADVVAELAG